MSSAVIDAECARRPVAGFIEDILSAHGLVELSLSSVTVAELVRGIYRAKSPEISARRRAFIEELIRLVPVHPLTGKAAWLFGQIEGTEAARGNVLPFADLMIAVSAIDQGYGVLTGNPRHFERVPGLTVIPSPQDRLGRAYSP